MAHFPREMGLDGSFPSAPPTNPGPRGHTTREEERRGGARREEERRGETDFEVPPLDPSDLRYHRFSLF